MTANKEKDLDEAYQLFIQALFYSMHLDKLDTFVDEKIMGYGTAIDEKILSISDFKKVIEKTKEQSAGLDMRFKQTPVFRRKSENTAIIVEEIQVIMHIDAATRELAVRCTSVLEYKDGKWMCIHCHASISPEVSKDDAWHVNKWQLKNAALQKQVAAQTADLVLKNRELEIEAALERVRAVAMGMKKPDDILDICKVMFTELRSLGFVDLRNTLINFWDDSHDSLIDYDYSDFTGANKAILSYDSHPIFEQFQRSIRESRDAFAKLEITEDLLESWKQRRADSGEYNDERLDNITALYYYFYSIGVGAVGISTFSCLTDEKLNMLKRFRNVFDLAYQRYQDIEIAYAQAREAKIEAALERVRSRTMGMQKSEELKEVIQVVYEQFVHLNINVGHTGFVMDYKARNDYNIWIADPLGVPSQVTIPYFDTLYYNRFNEAKENGSDFFAVNLTFEEKNRFYQELFKYVPGLPKEATDFYFSCPGLAASTVLLENVCLYIENFAGIPYTADENNTLMRFGKVFQQTYTRFLDLQKAEEQVKESMIETALERLRSRTLAMQHSNELSQTAAVLFQQLISLGIAPNCLYIGIIKDEIGHIEFWKTDEEGNKVSAQAIADINKSAVIKKMYKAWKHERKTLTIDIHGKELEKYYNYLSAELNMPFRLGLSQKRRVQTLAFFAKGFIGIASTDEQPPDTTFLLERFATVFNLTYTRFNDLKIAEVHAIKAEEDLIKLQAEKKRAEDALSELRTTQSQLIQSEKMASLGELTAGIAHEIQNPLNFVNNFSEVNAELIEELISEITKPIGDRDEHIQESLLKDIESNLAKINHHGKRADAIVKGMLQHSRSSSGQKEATDINLLADEYLRLAYYGLRAKDKSFNAILKTDFDQSMGNISVIPQDIGRVILNLITNAFYATVEKKNKATGKYDPTIILTTKKALGEIQISVKDNGTGIPQKVLDKIFQPFFTTKPSGQGTGLGLSMSYDIVRAHGGELRVKTKENEGTEFVIILPITDLAD